MPRHPFCEEIPPEVQAKPRLARLIGSRGWAGLEVYGHRQAPPICGEAPGGSCGKGVTRRGPCPLPAAPAGVRAGRRGCHHLSLRVTNHRRVFSILTPALSSCTTPAENGQGSPCQAAGTSAVAFPFLCLHGETGNGCAPQCSSPWKPGESSLLCAEQGVECPLIDGKAAQSFIFKEKKRH